MLDIIKNSEKYISNKSIASKILELKPLDISISELSVKVKDCCKILAKRGVIKNAAEYKNTAQYYI